MRIVLIAASMADARDWSAAQPASPDFVVVTPRSPDAARGHTADAVLATPAGLKTKAYPRLVEISLPSVMWRGR